MRKALTMIGILAFAAASGAQDSAPLTLDRAVDIALEKNPVRKVAMAEVKSADADSQQAKSAILPRVTFSESALRSNDPVFVFGTKLRQQRFTQSDFSLDSLNRPTPITDISSRFAGQWTLFDSRRSWLSISRAKLTKQAALQQLERTDQQLIFQVVQAYFDALLANHQLSLAEQSLKTAESIETQSRNRVETGLVVESDLLSAQVQTAERRQQYIRIKGDVAFANARLAITLGLPAETPITVAQYSPDQTTSLGTLADLETEAMKRRPDLLRARSTQSAQDKSVSMARSSFGPRLNAFGSWQTDSRSLGWTGGNNWTAGVELQFDLFSGGAKLAELNRQRADLDRVAAMRQVLEESVRLEVRRAYYDADSARQQVEVAHTAISQADESLRIQQNRYQVGLSTVTELLRVEEAQHRATTDYWNAVFRAATSRAALELATGTLTPSSSAVMQ